MKSLLGALILIVTLMGLIIVVAYVGHNPQSVQVVWGDTHITTQEPVILLSFLLFSTVLFYMGRFAAWVIALPRIWAEKSAQKTQQSHLEALAEAFTALESGHFQNAKTIAKPLPFSTPSTAETVLILLLKLKCHLLSPKEAAKVISLPHIGPLVALQEAIHAAKVSQWADVRNLTFLGLQHAPQHAELLTLHFKAMVHLNDPDLVSFLPRIKPLLGPTPFKLLTMLLTGVTSPQARQLDHAWVHAFQQWLPTPQTSFPLFQNEA